MRYFRHMKSASVHEIRDELEAQKPQQLVQLCLRLAKFKKENKELLTYLLFEARDEAGFIRSAKEEVTTLFAEINRVSLYYAKKSIRKILRLVNRYVRYSGSKETEADLLIFFCRTLQESGIPYTESTALHNLYQTQLRKISGILDTLHEDVRYDFSKELERL